jgi:hypothetical protein
VNEKRGTPGVPTWQRNDYEHVIRNEKSYLAIVKYVLNNPSTWEQDSLFLGQTSLRYPAKRLRLMIGEFSS